MLAKTFQASTVSDKRPQSPRSRRGALADLFSGLNIGSANQTFSGVSNRVEVKKRLPRPLPAVPITKPVQKSFPVVNRELFHEVKRTCMPELKRIPREFALDGRPIWMKTSTLDSTQKSEYSFVNQISGAQIRCCDLESKNIIECCTLCDYDNWIFQGSEYDPYITMLYAKMDGCIPSSVKLVNSKFIIPWRYKNRRTEAVTWKVIHMCGRNIEDAECETLVVNLFRDRKLRRIIEYTVSSSGKLRGAKLVEFLLQIVGDSLGDYGLPKGATSSQADRSLYTQMIKQGHNFMFLGEVQIGLCRHKALLFKILCDYVGLECALVTGYSTGGRHQWNVVTLRDPESGDMENYIVDPTSPYFTWTRQGSIRMKAYKINHDESFGHGGITMKLKGIL